MFELIVFAVIVAALIAALGLPYRQTWYSRWHG
ncbi:hypothetical protein MPNTM1_03599 [Mycolicibacterium parafortuitum]